MKEEPQQEQEAVLQDLSPQKERQSPANPPELAPVPEPLQKLESDWYDKRDPYCT